MKTSDWITLGIFFFVQFSALIGYIIKLLVDIKGMKKDIERLGKEIRENQRLNERALDKLENKKK